MLHTYNQVVSLDVIFRLYPLMSFSVLNIASSLSLSIVLFSLLPNRQRHQKTQGLKLNNDASVTVITNSLPQLHQQPLAVNTRIPTQNSCLVGEQIIIDSKLYYQSSIQKFSSENSLDIINWTAWAQSSSLSEQAKGEVVLWCFWAWNVPPSRPLPNHQGRGEETQDLESAFDLFAFVVLWALFVD